MRLAENRAFSARNSKHTYLLKSLVRCGGCSCPYVGDPCHGRFYYRCSTRCGKHPTIKEEILNNAVWQAVVDAILNPKVIENEVEKLYHRKTLQRYQTTREANEIATAMAKLKTEEERLVEAYRIGVLSPVLLGQELEKLEVRKSPLEERQIALTQALKRPAVPPIKKSIRDYCEAAAARIKSFTFEEQQRFLRVLVRSIVFEGDLIRIRSVIPIHADNSAKTAPSQPTSSVVTSKPAFAHSGPGLLENHTNRISPTTIDPSGRNTPLQNKGFSDEENEKEPDYFEFTLEAPIVTQGVKLWKKRQAASSDTFQSPEISSA
jgi:hypothetical protein